MDPMTKESAGFPIAFRLKHHPRFATSIKKIPGLLLSIKVYIEQRNLEKKLKIIDDETLKMKSQVIKARFGKSTHIVYCCFAIFTNLVVMLMLMLAGTAVLTSLVQVLSYIFKQSFPLSLKSYENICRV